MGQNDDSATLTVASPIRKKLYRQKLAYEAKVGELQKIKDKRKFVYK